jgi:hypothetical protein
MENLKAFDYAQPTRDSLAGIYLEASDEVGSEQAGSAVTEPARQSVPQSAALFGLTLTADDRANAKLSNARPTAEPRDSTIRGAR